MHSDVNVSLVLIDFIAYRPYIKIKILLNLYTSKTWNMYFYIKKMIVNSQMNNRN